LNLWKVEMEAWCTSFTTCSIICRLTRTGDGVSLTTPRLTAFVIAKDIVPTVAIAERDALAIVAASRKRSGPTCSPRMVIAVSTAIALWTSRPKIMRFRSLGAAGTTRTTSCQPAERAIPVRALFVQTSSERGNMARESLRQVWDKFFWSDWRADEALAVSSFAARGLWMEILALMAKAEPRGYLLINSQPPDEATLQVLVRAKSRQELRRLLAELRANDVCSETPDGVLFSRRMVRQAEQSQRNAANGARGGNPKLQESVGKSDNRKAKRKVNRPSKPQKPEARSQKPDQERGADAPAPTRALLTLFDTLHQARIGQPAAIQGGKDAKLLAQIYAWYGPDVTERLIRAFFASQDDFIAQAGFTVGVLYSQVGKLLAREAQRTRPASDTIATPVRTLCDAAGLRNADVLSWFPGTRIEPCAGGQRLIVPDDDVRAWIRKHYAAKLQAAAAARGELPLEIAS
jgi:hypothetical protein